MKKILVIFLLLTFPILVDASTIEGNISGAAITYPSGGSASGGSTFNCEYIRKVKQYGLRITFYSEDGKQAPSRSDSTKQSKTVDVWDWDSDGSAVGDYKGEVDGSFEKREEKDFLRGYGYKTKLDYLKGEKLAVVRGEYTIYRDIEAKNKGDKGNPLHYIGEQERLAEYFTTPEVVERYAILADADIDVGTGTFYILLEPLFLIYRNGNCISDKTEYRGRFSSTEIGKLYSKWDINLADRGLRVGAYFGLMLA